MNVVETVPVVVAVSVVENALVMRLVLITVALVDGMGVAVMVVDVKVVGTVLAVGTLQKPHAGPKGYLERLL